MEGPLCEAILIQVCLRRTDFIELLPGMIDKAPIYVTHKIINIIYHKMKVILIVNLLLIGAYVNCGLLFLNLAVKDATFYHCYSQLGHNTITLNIS